MERLCLQTPALGSDSDGNPLTEPGYVHIPPCVWSRETDVVKAAGEGLAPSVHLPLGTELLIRKRSRNTFQGTYGEMGSWQMRGIPVGV